MTRRGHHSTPAEQDAAVSAAMHGALHGAARWGIYSAILSGCAQWYSPLYRGLTIQFKIYLGMSLMIFGGYVWAEQELHDFGVQLGKQKRLREYNYRLAELEAEERRLGLAKQKEDESGGGGG